MTYYKDIMKKEMYVPIFGLIAGELMIFYGNVFYGLVIHIVNFLFTIIMIIFVGSLELKMKNILRYIILVILLQMINFSMPQLFTIAVLQYLLIGGIMIIPIYYIIKDKMMLYKESRIDPIRFYVPLVSALLIGFIVIVLQYEMPISSEMVYISGKVTTICLIISITITLLLSGAKYWNKYASDTLDMSSNSLLFVFIMIVVYKIISIL